MRVAQTFAGVRPSKLIHAYDEGVETTSEGPVAVLLDNKPSNHAPAVHAAVGETLVIPATKARPQNKGHVEGAFGLFSQHAPPMKVDAGTPKERARQSVELCVRTFFGAWNMRPRANLEPYECNWRMAWAGNVTLYDTEGVACRSLRYGLDAGGDIEQLVARMVDEVISLVECRSDVPVVTIQDGAPELDVLVRELRERLPEAVPRWQLVDFHHAISYLDEVIAARDDGDPCDMRHMYRWMKMMAPNESFATYDARPSSSTSSRRSPPQRTPR